MSKLVALIKQGFNEIPEVMLSTMCGIIAIPIGTYNLKKYYDRDGDNRRYKETFVIMRSDDPRAKLIHKD